MAWTTPATVVTGATITAAWGNTYVRDNTRYLKGLDGGVTIEDTLTIPSGKGLVVDSPTFVVDGSGNAVGFGTATPGAPVHVNSTSAPATDYVQLIRAGQSGSAQLAVGYRTDGSSNAAQMFVRALAGLPLWLGTNSAPNAIQIADNGDITLANGLDASAIDSGTLDVTRLPSSVILASENISQLTNDSGYLTSASNLNASNLNSGTVAKARLPGNLDFRTLTVADNGTSQLGTAAAPMGLAIVVADGPTFHRPALFLLYGSSNTVSKTADPDSGFTTTSGSASKSNVYWSGSAYTIENKTGASRNYYVCVIDVGA